jgi:hypothetical protein
MGDRILHPRAPGLDHPKRFVRSVCTGEPDFGGRMAREIEQQVAPASSPADIQVESRVRLEVHQHIRFWITPDQVPVQPTGTPRLIESRIKKGAAVIGPGHPGRDARDSLRQKSSGGEILDVERELLSS